MKPTKIELEAIEQCDSNFDGVFYYGVTSTKIFCKPSCRSPMPKEENIIVSSTPTEFEMLGFRPCKRCKPTHEKIPDVEWIEVVQLYIQTQYYEKLTLSNIADNTHSSPFHLHRKFKELTCQTIHEYLIQIRMDKAMELLENTDKSISEIGNLIGLRNMSQFIRDFKKYTGNTPQQYIKEIKK